MGVNFKYPIEESFLSEAVAGTLLEGGIHEFLEKLPGANLLVFRLQKIYLGLNPI